MADLSINVNIGQTGNELTGIVNRLQDMTKFWNSLSPIIKDIVQLNFAMGGRPKWPPGRGVANRGNKALIFAGAIYKAATNPRITTRLQSAQWDAFVGKFGVRVQKGSKETVWVKPHTRRVTQMFGHPIAPRTVKVKGHPMKLNLQPMPYFCIPLGYGEPERIQARVLDYIFGGVIWER